MSNNGLKSGSNLEKVLKAGHFAFTGECGPPKGANVEHLKEKFEHLRGNGGRGQRHRQPDRCGAHVQCGGIGHHGGQWVEPNFQMVCRDRNRLAMMADVLGVYSLGIRNMLCLSGDHQKFGNHPQSKNVYDIDSMQLIAMVKKMRDEGKFINDEDSTNRPRCSSERLPIHLPTPYEFRIYRLANKIDAGADFIQTQCIYNMPRFRDFMKKAVDMGLTEKAYILAGVTPMKSAAWPSTWPKWFPAWMFPKN
jgi:methylenetetrahydrofolate reductase (NADPH)